MFEMKAGDISKSSRRLIAGLWAMRAGADEYLSVNSSSEREVPCYFELGSQHPCATFDDGPKESRVVHLMRLIGDEHE